MTQALIFLLTGEYPSRLGGVADHTSQLVYPLSELTVALCGGDVGLSLEYGAFVYRVGRAFAAFNLRFLALMLDVFLHSN